MRQKSGPRGTASQNVIKDIRRATRKQYSAEEKIRVVLDGLRGEETIAELCRQIGRHALIRITRGRNKPCLWPRAMVLDEESAITPGADFETYPVTQM